MDHSLTVLAAVIPDRRDLVLKLISSLEAEHFEDPQRRSIFQLLDRYYTLTGAVLQRAQLSDLLRRQQADEAKVLSYEDLYDTLASTTVEDHEFKYAIEALRDARTGDLTGGAIADLMEIQTTGKQVGKQFLHGHSAARQYALTRFSEIDRLDADPSSSPEGTIRGEGPRLKQMYADRKSGKIQAGLQTGLTWIDNLTGGLHPGELTMFAAYTAQGKSHIVTQASWYAAVHQGKNVFFGTTETIRDQVLRRIVARHSREPQFGLPDGLNSFEIKEGKLSPEHEAVLMAVIDDLENNPAYGNINIVQFPVGATLSMLEAKARRWQQSVDTGLIVCDYLTLFEGEIRRGKRQEELNDIIRNAKALAVSFADGRGVPFVSPWQVNKDKWETARTRGGYDLGCLSDTSEAEKSADNIFSLLRDVDSPHDAAIQALKLRDAELPPTHHLYVDYKNSYLGEKATADAVSNILEDLGV